MRSELKLSDAKEELSSALESLGFECSDLESHSDLLQILAVPESARRLDWESLLRDIFHRMHEGVNLEALSNSLRTQLAASLACHSSVRRGQRLSVDEIKALLQQLAEVQWGGLCPHGRPVWFQWSHADLEKIFHRE